MLRVLGFEVDFGYRSGLEVGFPREIARSPAASTYIGAIGGGIGN